MSPPSPRFGEARLNGGQYTQGRGGGEPPPRPLVPNGSSVRPGDHGPGLWLSVPDHHADPASEGRANSGPERAAETEPDRRADEGAKPREERSQPAAAALDGLKLGGRNVL